MTVSTSEQFRSGKNQLWDVENGLGGKRTRFVLRPVELSTGLVQEMTMLTSYSPVRKADTVNRPQRQIKGRPVSTTVRRDRANIFKDHGPRQVHVLNPGTARQVPGRAPS